MNMGAGGGYCTSVLEGAGGSTTDDPSVNNALTLTSKMTSLTVLALG